ncbi:MAG TPA: hypothetical protein VJI75_03140 [Candidatus Nanoarchaeia archaeon]|nr:hypothetical protein [Candidatus Nanoarchaeia archaeon]
MHQKRAQAAMEFLLTYGWAILIVLVVIAALAYFGVLSPSKFLPEKCTFQPGILCKDFSAMRVQGSGFEGAIEGDKAIVLLFDLVNSGDNIQFRGGSITNDKGMKCLEIKKECEPGTEIPIDPIKVDETHLCTPFDVLLKGRDVNIVWPAGESLRSVTDFQYMPIPCYPSSELQKGDKLSGTVKILYSKPGSDIIHESYGEFSFTVN